MDEQYASLLTSAKERIRTAQVRAALAVNRELLLLYWNIGRETCYGSGRKAGA